MIKKKLKRLLALALVAALALSMGIIGAGATVKFSDIKGHWAENEIYAGVTAGYISGYPDGTFQPNKAVSRSEFCKMLNHALGVSQMEAISFADVPTTLWCYDEIRKAMAADYAVGYTDSQFNPNEIITRQQAAMFLARIVTNPDKMLSLDDFKDSADIPTQARESVQMVYSKGYMVGNQLSRFEPAKSLTRGEAVKLINNMLKNEVIVNSNVTVSTAGKEYSDTIYVNNITVAGASGVANLTLDNCRVLGTLTMKLGEEDSVTLLNSGVNRMNVAQATGDTTISVSGTSYVKETQVNRAVALREVNLTGKGFQELTLSGSNLAADTVRLAGTFDRVSLGDSATIRATSGAIKAFDLTGKGTVTFQSADIGTLTVDKAAAGSSMFLANGVTVDKAQINGKIAFTGEGLISVANQTVSGVTYETAPGKINNTASEDPEQPSAKLSPVISPARGSTGVSVEPTILISFDEALVTADGSTLTAAYVRSDALQLRKGSATGAQVSYTASVSSAKRTITITPNVVLEEDTTYYITMPAGKLQSAEETGKYNEVFTSYFRTEEQAPVAPTGPLEPAMSPAHKSTGVDVGSDILLTFDEVIYNDQGSTLTDSYVEGQAVQLRKGSETGSLVDITATISSSKKVITIDPDVALDDESTYYLILLKGTVSNSSGDKNSRMVWYFTTGEADPLLPVVTPGNGKTSVSTSSTVKLAFDQAVYKAVGETLTAAEIRQRVELHRDAMDGEAVPFNAAISSDRKTITLTPVAKLASDTTYYVVLPAGSVVNENGDPNQRCVSKFATGATLATNITISPKDSAVDVDLDQNITITFDGLARRADGGTLKASYVEASAVELRQGSTAGSKLDFSATVSTDSNGNTVVTIDPNNDLTQKTKYCVRVLANTLQYADGHNVEAIISYFTTSDISPLALSVPEEDITSSTASILVDYQMQGALTVSYQKNSGSRIYLEQNFTPNKEADVLQYDLDGLIPGTAYTVSATLTINGTNYTKTVKFTTDKISTDTTLASLSVVTERGSYGAVQGSSTSIYTATIQMPDSGKVRLKPLANADNSAVVVLTGVNGVTKNETIAPGTSSTELIVVEGENVFTFQVTAESGAVRDYTLKVNVN